MRPIRSLFRYSLLSAALAMATTTASHAVSLNAQDRLIQDEIFYFVLPDRFANGDAKNDNGGIIGTADVNGFDPTRANYYHGGDLKGLTKKLNYLRNLGVTSLWISPIFKNKAVEGDSAGYHGYWTLDYTQVDPHFGSNQELKQLINVAHAHGIKIFLDVVMNHTADVIKYEECHSADGALLADFALGCPYRTVEQSEIDPFTPFIPAGQETLKSPAWLNDPQYYHNQGHSTFNSESSLNGDFFGLDDLKTEDPAVVAGMIAVR